MTKCWLGRLSVSLLALLLPAISVAEVDAVTVHGVRREFIVHIPEKLRASAQRPAVLGFHGGGGEAEGFAHSSGLTQAAEKYGFVIVYPQGTGPWPRRHKFQTWNAGACCGPAHEKNVDDIGFVSAIIDRLIERYQVNPRRIFATGISNGAYISYRLACELSERIAAISPVAISTANEPCRPLRPVPILHIHGTADPCARFDGGTCGGCFEEFFQKMFFLTPKKKKTWQCESVRMTMERWRSLNGCSGQTEIFFSHGKAQCAKAIGCKDNAEVALCAIEGAGHTWPGGSHPNNKCEIGSPRRACRLYEESVGITSFDMDANEIMWRFFEQHQLSQKFIR